MPGTGPYHPRRLRDFLGGLFSALIALGHLQGGLFLFVRGKGDGDLLSQYAGAGAFALGLVAAAIATYFLGHAVTEWEDAARHDSRT